MLRAPLRVSSRPAARRVAVMGLFGLGVPELAVIAGVTALIFGAQGVASVLEVWDQRAGGGGPPSPTAPPRPHFPLSLPFWRLAQGPASCRSLERALARP